MFIPASDVGSILKKFPVKYNQYKDTFDYIAQKRNKTEPRP